MSEYGSEFLRQVLDDAKKITPEEYAELFNAATESELDFEEFFCPQFVEVFSDFAVSFSATKRSGAVIRPEEDRRLGSFTEDISVSFLNPEQLFMVTELPWQTMAA